MRTINRTNQFKRDYKRESRGHHRSTLDGELTAVLQLLVNDSQLPERLRDHPLTGEWKDHRDCHIKPDLLLIYRLPDAENLDLVRIGYHSQLGF